MVRRCDAVSLPMAAAAAHDPVTLTLNQAQSSLKRPDAYP